MLISSLPHARGGVSPQQHLGTARIQSSPRTWGCFRLHHPRLSMSNVFPTHVGVFLVRFLHKRPILSLPHARGGVSAACVPLSHAKRSSPRTWGCFCRRLMREIDDLVFPTHVGVFPGQSPRLDQRQRLPHARGGVSSREIELSRAYQSSPRTWGCFCDNACGSEKNGVFPTHVGVFLSYHPNDSPRKSLPHARGGVSSSRPPRIAQP